MKEFVVGGLLMSPFVKFALLAAVLFLPLHVFLVWMRFDKWFWHPYLAEAALYACLLTVLNLSL